MFTQILTDFDIHLIAEGSHYRAYEKLGAHPMTVDGVTGTVFSVWAPNAEYVAVVSDSNGWNPEAAPMALRGDSGIWECFVAGLDAGALYKYHIRSRFNGYCTDKADPYGFAAEIRPHTASKVWNLDGYAWTDQTWMEGRTLRPIQTSPVSIYEVHLGSWMRVPEENDRWLTYRELAHKLTTYVHEMGFTHVEFMPVSEYPFDGSWGYQTVGYFAPTSRHGTPDDFKFLVDTLHQGGVGVILDWVPAHFPKDEHGLGYFDGTHLYEHADPRQGSHPDWGTLIFNYGRAEVRDFLLSNAVFWLDEYHIDALRVDAVASILYLDYGRKDGEWIPNQFGGKENLEAVSFLRQANQVIQAEVPGAAMIAEESTSWPGVSRPAYLGGLGFDCKWNMGWMHDMLEYMGKDPIYRRHHHNKITFSMIYAFTENFVLPFSHDEVVYGKGSMIRKMPGDNWQRFANLRLLYGFQFGHPGKKLLFMGCEFGQWSEWNHDTSLDWHLLGEGLNRGMQRWVRDLNTYYRSDAALYEMDFESAGFAWIDCDDNQNSVVSFLRRGRGPSATVFVCNFTPEPRHNYRVGVPAGGLWKEELNSDAPIYGGSGQGNLGAVDAAPLGRHGHPYSLTITVPPLGVVVFRKKEIEAGS